MGEFAAKPTTQLAVFTPTISVVMLQILNYIKNPKPRTWQVKCFQKAG